MRSGEEAAAPCETLDTAIDLLVTDRAMPGMNGVEVTRLVRRRSPDLGVLLMSAYSEHALEPELLGYAVEYVAMPFGFSHLAERVRGMLNPVEPTGRVDPAG